MNSRGSWKEVLWMVVMMHPYLLCVRQPKVLVASKALSCSYQYQHYWEQSGCMTIE